MCGRGDTFVAHMGVLRQVCDVWRGEMGVLWRWPGYKANSLLCYPAPCSLHPCQPPASTTPL